jgi:hypothetical protein
MRGLFGLELLWTSRNYFDPDGNDKGHELRESIWSLVQKNLGEYGDSRQRNILSREPNYALPQCLLNGRVRRFPDRLQFKLLLQDKGRLLVGDENLGVSLAEDSVITFLYEAARNSYEHGRYDRSNRIIPGIKGIGIEKLVFSNERELRYRKDLPETVRLYLKRLWGGKKGRKLIIAFTVADLGQGIHNTIPGLSNERPWQTFLRAFEAGVSRKPKGIGMDRGMGLAKLTDSAERLDAFLFVHSAGIAAYRDFSIRRKDSRGELLTPWPSQPGQGCTGTSFTLLWPLA